MRKVIVIFFIALLGLSMFMVGRKILEYGLIKNDTIFVERTKELEKELEKVNSDIENIRVEKKDELKRLEEWEKLLKETKEDL